MFRSPFRAPFGRGIQTIVYIELSGELQAAFLVDANLKRLRFMVGEIVTVNSMAGNVAGVTIPLSGNITAVSVLLGSMIASVNLTGAIEETDDVIADITRMRGLLGESIAAAKAMGNIGRVRGISGLASMAALIMADLGFALRVPEGYRVSPPLFLRGQAVASEISWVATVPPGTTLTVDTGLSAHPDVQPTAWQQATNSGAIPVLPQGFDMHNKFLWVRVNLATSDPELSPKLYSLAVSINGRVSVINVREGTWEYLRDYDLGDIVTARYPGVITMDARIIEVVEEYTVEEGAKHRVILGKEWPDLISTTKAGRKNIDPEVRR